VVGNICDKQLHINRKNTIWDNNKIIDDCSGCNMLPLCMGECVMRRYINKIRIDCDKELYTQNIKERLLKIIDTQTKF
jgi:radical SAM protein with 4Fe4S-binding SPASM domain